MSEGILFKSGNASIRKDLPKAIAIVNNNERFEEDPYEWETFTFGILWRLRCHRCLLASAIAYNEIYMKYFIFFIHS